MNTPQYVAIGHICRDVIPGGYTLGGTVSFSSRMAHALGVDAAILSSGADDIHELTGPLDGITKHIIPAPESTTFHNQYTSAGRKQLLLGRAASIQPEHIPGAWKNPELIHIAPVANEVSSDMLSAFPSSFIGVTPQGWMRIWDDNRRVIYRPWPSAYDVLPVADAVVMSIEDVAYDTTLIQDYGMQARCLVVTCGADGADIYQHGKRLHIESPIVQEADPTGAGDIFAAAFFIHLQRHGDVRRAGRFAALLASDSVTRRGLDSLPRPGTITQAWQTY